MSQIASHSAGMRERAAGSRLMRAGVFLFVLTGVAALQYFRPTSALAQATTAPPPPTTQDAAEAKQTGSEQTLAELQRLVEEQRKRIEAQQQLIDDQKKEIGAQNAAIEAQQKKLEELEQQLLSMNRRLDELQQERPSPDLQSALEERLKRVEESAQKVPELPPDVVSAGEFPGSIRIPGTDAAIKFAGRVRTAGIFTLGPLVSEDRFLTNSIPVEGTSEAGKGPRTTFSANTSRLNFELRTPTGVGQMRAFIEGDFFGQATSGARTSFRLRHAYAQYLGFIAGQTWSTFSDPQANAEDLDFEGINGENVIRQPQLRYTWRLREDLRLAAAAETPEVSLTGGQGVNVVPDLVSHCRWNITETGHLQGAMVIREIRGETPLRPGEVASTFAWGGSVSGVLPVPYLQLTDRVVFQFNFGAGNARYINDLNSLGGQDAVFDSMTAELERLPALGWYVDWEHNWKRWQATRGMRLRSSLIWGFVIVDNLDSQPGDAYHRTHRFSTNLVFSPIQRIDFGVQYIYGTRTNKDGSDGSSDQVQVVGFFQF